MLKKILYVLGLSLVSLFLFSCIFESDNEDFTFELEIKDSAGNAVENINVSLINNISNCFGEFAPASRAQTSISFNMGIAAHCSLIIKDIRKNVVRNLLSDDLNADSYVATWNGKNDEGQDLPSGLYYCQMTSSTEGDIFYKDNHVMYLQSIHNKIGETNSEGTFSTEDKKPFINLFKTDSLQIVDEYGNYLEKEEFSDTTVICLYQEDEPQIIQFEYVEVKNKKNNFEVIWDPENRGIETSDEFDIHPNQKTEESFRGSEDCIVPSDDAELRGNYPNPFN